MRWFALAALLLGCEVDSGPGATRDPNDVCRGQAGGHGRLTNDGGTGVPFCEVGHATAGETVTDAGARD